MHIVQTRLRLLDLTAGIPADKFTPTCRVRSACMDMHSEAIMILTWFHFRLLRFYRRKFRIRRGWVARWVVIMMCSAELFQVTAILLSRPAINVQFLPTDDSKIFEELVRADFADDAETFIV